MAHVTAYKNVRLGDLCTMQDFADQMGVTPSTVSAYRSRGYLPDPVGYVNGVPVWTHTQMQHYISARPGQGARTDQERVARR